MFGYIFLVVVAVVLYGVSSTLLSLNRNIAAAKASGLPYAISPIRGIAGFFWTAIHPAVIGIFKSLPYSEGWLWPMLVEPHRSWHYAQELRECFGEIFLIVSPGQIYMYNCNAEAIMQMATRRNDFVKPVEIYGIVDIFGSSILSLEGPEWKRHRKIVAPAFSEKSNALVWKESLKQANGMLRFWSEIEGNVPGNLKIKDTAVHTALMTLHVISGAGFGIRQVWDGEDEGQLGKNIVPGFNTAKLKENHKLAFKDAINTLLHGMIWMAIFPVWLLKQSPFGLHKKLVQSFFECGDYFRELSEYKTNLLECGEAAEKGTMDLMGPLIKASENGPEDTKGLYLTKQEVIADSWIFLFAGHETSGNTLHFALLFLAIALDSQKLLQADIDSIVGSRPLEDWTYETDMGRLYLSMVGATMNETLRLMPPIIDIPKIVRGIPQTLRYDGKTITVPATTSIHLSALGVHRNPRYWPHQPSKISLKAHDLDDFVPQRWLRSKSSTTTTATKAEPITPTITASAPIDGLENASFEAGDGLFIPTKGAFIPFSEGARSCPGRRFAQVEITAVLAALFQTHSAELDVREWASDAEVERMGTRERRALYERAKARARKLIGASETVITLQMRGTSVPLRFVRRGEERFMRCYGEGGRGGEL